MAGSESIPVSIERTGLTCVVTAKESPRVNVVFVHGLRGHPRKTWAYSGEGLTSGPQANSGSTKRNRLSRFLSVANKAAAGDPQNSSKDVFWPSEELSQKVPNATVWTYGYDADVNSGFFQPSNTNSVLQHGDDLMVKLERGLENEDPIIFVAHSLGGLVVKRALRQMQTSPDRKYIEFHRRIRAVVFCGTPHRGSGAAAWAQIASKLFSVALMDVNSKLLQDLEVNSQILDLIQTDFLKLLDTSLIAVHSFIEGRAMTGVKGLNSKIVDDFSAKVGWSRETYEFINADHREMVKKEGVRDITSVLRRLVGDVAKALPAGEKRASSCVLAEANTKNDPVRGPCHFIPFLRNRRFIGRDQILDDLKQKLLIQKETSRFALFGLGGVGKTQVALQLAHWVKEHMPAYSIFWIPALSVRSFEQACTEIVRKLALHKTSENESAMVLVQRYLSSEQAGQWLLIVDNADDADVVFGASDIPSGINPYLPNNEDGITLFTTRSREMAVSLAGCNMTELKEMSAEEARSLFERSVPKGLLCDEEDTAQLLGELNYLPLAITQAAAYLNSTNESVKTYIRLLHGSHDDVVSLMSRGFADRTRYQDSQNAVATTWLVSFNRILKSDSFAAKLLGFISCIEPKAIPQSILPKVGSEERMVHAIGLLRGYAFLVKREDENLFDMHRLVHLAAQLWIREGVLEQIVEHATWHMAAIFPCAEIVPSDDYASRFLWRAYLPHAIQMLRVSEEQDMEGMYTEATHSLRYKVGHCLLDEGWVKEAIRQFAELQRWDVNRLAEDDPSRLSHQHALALAYLKAGHNDKSVKLAEHIVTVLRRTRAEEDSFRLRSEHMLALAYRVDGQIDKAIKLFQHLVVVKGRILDEDHPSFLASLPELGRIYAHHGQLDKGIELLELVVAAQGRTLDKDHPPQLAFMNALAEVYTVNGLADKAIGLLELVVAMQGRTLDKYHPSQLVSMNALAELYTANGQVDKATGLLEHVVTVRGKTLGAEHPSLISAQCTLGLAYQASGQVVKAIGLFEHAAAVRKRTLGEEHPSFLAVQDVLSEAYKELQQ